MKCIPSKHFLRMYVMSMDGVGYTRQLKTRLDDYHRELDNNRKSYESSLENEKKGHKHTQKKQREAYDKSKFEMKDYVEKKIDKITDQSREIIQNKSDQYKKNILARESMFKKERDVQRDKFDDQIRSIKKVFKHNINSSNKNHEKIQDDSSSAFKGQVKKIHAQNSNQMGELANKTNARYGNFIDQIKKQDKEKRESFQKESSEQFTSEKSKQKNNYLKSLGQNSKAFTEGLENQNTIQARQLKNYKNSYDKAAKEVEKDVAGYNSKVMNSAQDAIANKSVLYSDELNRILDDNRTNANENRLVYDSKMRSAEEMFRDNIENESRNHDKLQTQTQEMYKEKSEQQQANHSQEVDQLNKKAKKEYEQYREGVGQKIGEMRSELHEKIQDQRLEETNKRIKLQNIKDLQIKNLQEFQDSEVARIKFSAKDRMINATKRKALEMKRLQDDMGKLGKNMRRSQVEENMENTRKNAEVISDIQKDNAHVKDMMKRGFVTGSSKRDTQIEKENVEKDIEHRHKLQRQALMLTQLRRTLNSRQDDMLKKNEKMIDDRKQIYTKNLAEKDVKFSDIITDIKKDNYLKSRNIKTRLLGENERVKKSFKKALERKDAAGTQSVKRIKSNMDHDLENYITRTNKEVESMKNEFNNEKLDLIDGMVAKHYDQVYEQRNNFAKRLENVEESIGSELYRTKLSMKKSNDSADKRVKNIIKKANITLARQSKTFQKMTDETRRDNGRELQIREQESKRSMTRLQNDMAKLANRLSNKNERKINTLTDFYENKLANLISEYDQKLKVEKNLSNQDIKRLKLGADQERDRLITKYESEIEKIRQDNKLRMERVKSSYNSQVKG